MADQDVGSIVVLKGLEAVRRRPGMYVGDPVDGSGMHHLLWEVLGNAIDEHLRGTATHVSVLIDGETITVEDDGRGISVEPWPQHANRSVLEVVFTELLAGTSERPHVHVSPGLRGVGLAPVAALSSRLEVESRWNGRRHRADFERGEFIGAVRDEGPTERKGTRVQLTPDFTIFTRRPWNLEVIGDRMRTLAAFNPRLTVELQGEILRAPAGLADHVRYLVEGRRALHPEPLRVQGTDHDVEVEVALQWLDAPDAMILGFVSQAQAPEGTHLAGFWSGLRRALASIAPKRVHGLRPTAFRERVAPGLVAAVHAGLYDARFGDPRRDRLLNPEARTAVAHVLAAPLAEWLRSQPALLKLLLRRLPHR